MSKADQQAGLLPLWRCPLCEPAAPSSTRLLNTALARLARDPRDMGALVDAGSAALDTGRYRCRYRFLHACRADVSRQRGRARAHRGHRAAIEPAVRRRSAGSMRPIRRVFQLPKWRPNAALPYDLIGDNPAAQRRYQLALASGPRELRAER